MTLTPLEVTAGVGALAFTGAMIGVRQKALNDRKDAWWKRAQWAMEQTFSASPARRRVGLDALAVLARYPKATEEDLRILRVAVQRALDNDPAPGDDEA